MWQGRWRPAVVLVVIAADAVGSGCCWELGDTMLHSQPVICPSRWWCTFQVWIVVLDGIWSSQWWFLVGGVL